MYQKHEDKELGFLFKNNKVTFYDFITRNDDTTTWRMFWSERDVSYRLNYLTFYEYSLSNSTFYMINRSTLSLRVFEDYTRQKIVKIYQCRIFKEEKSFFNELDLLKDKYNESNRYILKKRKF